MLRFRAFGVPVYVQPAFWLTALLLGGGIKQPGLLLLWIATVFISVLVHELGHVAAMRMTGGGGQIVLTAFGGLAIPEAPAPRSRGQSIWISAAGPLAQLALGAGVALFMMSAGYTVSVAAGRSGIPFPHMVSAPGEAAPLYLFAGVNFLLYISFFWSVINLAPVYPLDGGQIARAFLGNKPALVLSLILGGAIALLCFTAGNLFMGLFFAWMAISNVQTLRQA